MSRILRAFLRHQEAIKRVLARYVPPEDRNDILQEAFLKAFAAEMTTPVQDPKAFLFRVAKNVAISEMTRKSRRDTDYLEDLSDSEVFEDERSGSVEAHIDGTRKLFVLSQALAHLPEEYQRVFLMRKLEGLRVKQIATRLSVSVSTVEKRLAKALVLCDRQLRKQRYDPAEFGLHAATHSRAGNGSTAIAQDGAAHEDN
jgi:RNA polymerase sigma-70 factor (ECF subfamily)